MFKRFKTQGNYRVRDENCSFLDLLLFSDDGKLKCLVNDRRDDFSFGFDIVNIHG